MAILAPTKLTPAELAHYRGEGFVLLRQVVPMELLADAQRMFEPWVDYFVDKWRVEGLLDDPCSDSNFGHRFMEAWRKAGRPHFRRSPNRFLINAEMYRFMTSQVFLDIAEQLIGTPELSIHGIFNGRPQLVNHPDTQTPWHQDSQYWVLDYGCPEPDTERRTHVVTMWMPLQPVDPESGCLQVMSLLDTKNRMFDQWDYDYARTGFLGLSPADVAAHIAIPFTMQPGDLLAFTQRTPHGAAPNLSDHIRWSVDIRYEATATATLLGQKYGFVAQSIDNPAAVTPLEAWLQKRELQLPA
ncbi:MAG TPA: phytanoyl-CoA dioxygenase family protein [Chloroflexota bacterium]|nr:phytanoyl-CoA dioxygenase family protein [Chloroflexota bacterium]